MRRLLLLSAIVSLVPSTFGQTPGSESARLYFDRAHGQAAPRPPMADIAQRLNLEVAVSEEPITTESLRGSRLLYLLAPSRPFTEAEKRAVAAFVKEGGSLLLVLDAERRQSLSKTGVNDLIAPFGMRLTADTEYLHNCGAIAKAGEINQADREIPYSGGRAVEGGTPFAYRLDQDGRPAQPFAAWKRLENGSRIVVMGEAMASIFLGTREGRRLSGVPRDVRRTTYWGKDSAIFMEEVLAWLAKASPAR